MKLNMIIMMFFCILTIGCTESAQRSYNRYHVDAQLINSYNDIAIRNAIISQHTLFPYHFIENSDELNELGHRDLEVLIEHFTKHIGHVNVRRHNTSAELYEARVKFVLDELEKAGINMDQISVSDDMPGGMGMTAGELLIIFEEEHKGTTGKISSSYRSGMRQ